jgi:hypothetical protein
VNADASGHPQKSRRSSRIRAVASAIAVVAVLGTLVVLAVVPLKPVTAASGTLTSPGTECNFSCPRIHPEDSISLPSGPTVTVIWAEANAAPLVVIVGNGSLPQCQWNAGSGSCSFHSFGGSYTIWAYSQTPYTTGFYVVNYTFSYDVPFL